MAMTALQSPSRSRVRWFPILTLVAIGTMINYLDRTVLGIAAPSLTNDLGLTATQMGVGVLRVFVELCLAPNSWRYLSRPLRHSRDLLRRRVFWSIFTGLMAAVRSLNGLILTRIGVGVFEAPCFPANSRILATWFPQHERARANAIYSVGQYAGLGFLSVPLFWMTQQFGWRGLFVIVGGVWSHLRPCVADVVPQPDGQRGGESG